MRRWSALKSLLLAAAASVGVVGGGADPAASQQKEPSAPLRWKLVKVDLRAKDSGDTANKGTTIRESKFMTTSYTYRHVQKDETGKVTMDHHYQHTFSVPPRAGGGADVRRDGD